MKNEDFMTPWADDFAYHYYRKLLGTIKENFQLRLISQAPEFLAGIDDSSRRHILLLRHDIDFDLGSAVRMAEIEHDFGIQACYMIMTTCPFYDIREHQADLNRLFHLGHRIGLHIDFHYVQYNETREEDVSSRQEWVVSAIERHAQRLEDVTGVPVRAVSYHRPAIRFLKGPLFIANRVNAYADDLMQWYLSDSKGQWRAGDPLAILQRPEHPLLQLLVHPVWWGDEHVEAGDRLQDFFERRTRDMSPERISAFDQILANHVTIRRSGLRTILPRGA